MGRDELHACRRDMLYCAVDGICCAIDAHTTALSTRIRLRGEGAETLCKLYFVVTKQGFDRAEGYSARKY